MPRGFLLAGLGALALASTPMAGQAPSGPPMAGRASELLEDIRTFEQRTGGSVGVAILHVESGRELFYKGAESFPMASVYKVPVALAILDLVDQGRLQAAQMVPVPEELRVESDGIAEQLVHPGISLSLLNLLELMLTRSDNTATDVLVKLAGGPAAVTLFLKSRGLHGIRVDRDTAALLEDFMEIGRGPYLERLEKARAEKRDLEIRSGKPNPAYDEDPRDTATPAATALMLARLHRGELLKPESTRLLLDIMARCRTGHRRLKGLLPEGTVVAHKTGSLGATANDAGILTLPRGKGHLVVVVFVKKSTRPHQARDRAIAEIARAAFDHALYGP
ncbi:MAG: class A beta-lactamase [Acidobacteria bacterium]|nr:class A beta-lactamase [Acidobacteriota bacterium]